MRSMFLLLIVVAAFQVSNNFRQDKSEAVGSLAKVIKDAQDFKAVQVSGQGTAVKAESEAGQNASNVTLQTMEERISQLTTQLQQKENHASALAAKVVELEAMLDIYTKEHGSQANSRLHALHGFRFEIQNYREGRYFAPDLPANDKRVLWLDERNHPGKFGIDTRADNETARWPHLTVEVNLDLLPHFTQPIQDKLADPAVPKSRPEQEDPKNPVFDPTSTDMWDPEEGYRELNLDAQGCFFEHGGFLGCRGGVGCRDGGYSVFSLVSKNPLHFAEEDGVRLHKAGFFGTALRNSNSLKKWFRKNFFKVGTTKQWGWELTETDIFHIGTHFTSDQAQNYEGKQAEQHFHFMANKAFSPAAIERIETVVNKWHKAGCDRWSRT